MLELVKPPPERDALLRSGSGIRRDLLLGARIIALLAAADDAQQALAAFGSDPCHGLGACHEPFARFEPTASSCTSRKRSRLPGE